MAVGLWAGTVGLPVLVWLFEQGRIGFAVVTAAATVAGGIPPLLLLVSGTVGLFVRGDAEYMLWALGYGASIPFHGILPWPQFAVFFAWSAMVGLASGIIYWLMVFSGRVRLPSTWAWIVMTLIGAALGGGLFGG